MSEQRDDISNNGISNNGQRRRELDRELFRLSIEAAHWQVEATRASEEAARLRAERDLIVRSASWRLTAPLRRGKSLARSVARWAHPRAWRMGLPGLASAVLPKLQSNGRLVQLNEETVLPPELEDDAILEDAMGFVRRRQAVRSLERSSTAPLVSVVVPTFDTALEHLQACVASVLEQTYPRWELRIVDDGSESPDLLMALARLPEQDARIHVRFEPANRGIAEATNRALADAEGDYVAFLDHDDVLHRDALLEVAQLLCRDDPPDVVYTDEQMIEDDGRPSAAMRKPDWSPTLACGAMYVGHLLVVRRDLLEECGGLDSRYENVQDFELMLRLSERTERIEHVPRVLYFWRRAPSSVASGRLVKADIDLLQAEAVNAHLRRSGSVMRAYPDPRHPHRLRLGPRTNTVLPPVTVLVTGSDDEDAVDTTLTSLASLTRASSTATRPAGQWTRDLVRMLESAKTPYVCCIEAGLVPVRDDWLDLLLVHALGKRVGVASALTLDADFRVHAAGLIAAAGRLLPALSGADPAEDGACASLSCAREVLAVSGAAVVVSMERLRSIGGLDPAYAAPSAAWVDASLRFVDSGFRNVVEPAAMVQRQKGSGRELDAIDELLLRDRWPERLGRPDPYGMHLTGAVNHAARASVAGASA